RRRAGHRQHPGAVGGGTHPRAGAAARGGAGPVGHHAHGHRGGGGAGPVRRPAGDRRRHRPGRGRGAGTGGPGHPDADAALGGPGRVPAAGRRRGGGGGGRAGGTRGPHGRARRGRLRVGPAPPPTRTAGGQRHARGWRCPPAHPAPADWTAMEGLAGVLFDMDGTLLDSERLWDRALGALAARYGRVLSDEARKAMVGRSVRETMKLFYRDLGVRDPDPHADSAFLADQMARLYATELTWRPGAAELVAEVRAAGLPAALVTTTGRRLVEVALDTLLGRSAFDVVVCGDDVTRPKPHPEPYLTAAARLGVPPAACVA